PVYRLPVEGDAEPAQGRPGPLAARPARRLHPGRAAGEAHGLRRGPGGGPDPPHREVSVGDQGPHQPVPAAPSPGRGDGHGRACPAGIDDCRDAGRTGASGWHPHSALPVAHRRGEWGRKSPVMNWFTGREDFRASSPGRDEENLSPFSSPRLTAISGNGTASW